MKYDIVLVQSDNAMYIEVTGCEAAWDTYNQTVEALGLLVRVWLMDKETGEILADSENNQ